MKLYLLQHPKLVLCFWFLLLYSKSYGQSTTAKELPVEILLKEASLKYQVVFNYNYQELKDLLSLNELPTTFDEFRKLTTEYSGLNFEPYSNKIWVIKKNFTHQIQFSDIANNPTEGVVLEQPKKLSNRFGNIFLNLEQYPGLFVFNYKDYDSQTLEIKKSSPKIIALNMIQFNLSEVILSNLYVKGVFLTSEKHITVKPKKTPLLAGQVQQDAFVTLLNLPQITASSESIAELNIKGGVNDQNLVLWNGIKIFQNGHFFGLLSAFNDNLIETITVIDNATPSQYGNALSGTVKLDFDDQYNESSTYGIGLNALSGHVFIKEKLAQDFEFSSAFQRSFTNLYQTPTFKSYQEKVYNNTEIELSETPIPVENINREDVYYYQDAQFQIKKKINKKLELNLQGIWFENDLNYTEKINSSNIKKSTFNNINSAIGFQAHYDWSDSNKLSLMYNFSSHKSEGSNNTFSGNLNTSQANNVDNSFLQLHWAKKNLRSQFSTGFDFEGTVVSNRFNNNVTSAFLNLVQIGNIYATFGDYTYQSDVWRFYTGIRNVYYQRDQKWSIEPRFSISYAINRIFELSLRGERKSQNLRQIVDLDQNFLGIEKRRWLLSGQDQSALQNTHQIETIIKFDNKKFGGYTSLFLRELAGLSSNDQRFLNENQFIGFQNGTSQIWGAMFHLFYKRKIFNTWLSYAYLNEKIETQNQTFTGNNKLNYNITWGNNIKYKRWSFSQSFVFHDGLPFTSVNEITPIILDTSTGLNAINYNTTNNEKLPDYFRIDSAIQYDLKSKPGQMFRFSLGLINLTDTHNILRRNFRLNRVDSNQIQKIETRGLGFTANFGVLYVF